MNAPDPLSGLRPGPAGRPPAPLGDVLRRGRALRTRRRLTIAGTLAVVAAALGLGGFALAASSDDDSVVAGPGSTTTTTAPTADTTQTPVADTTPAPGRAEALTSARWVVNGAGGLVTDGGVRLADTSPDLGSRTVMRFTFDGGIVFDSGAEVQRWAFGAEDPAPVATGDLGPAPAEITAANGYRAAVLMPFGTVLPSADATSRIQVLDGDGGAVLDTFLGGPDASEVRLVDFDGRRLIVARGPSDTDGVEWDHAYVDLVCGPSCTEWFRAVPGTVALVGPDDPAVPPALETGPLDACATWAEQPVAATPPDLPPAVAATFSRLSLGVARCDRFALGLGDRPGWDDDAAWLGLADILDNDPVAIDTDSGSRRWSGADGGVAIDADGIATITLPTARPAADVHVELTTDRWLTISGTVPADAAASLRAAIAATDYTRVSDALVVDDTVATPEAWTDALAELIGTGLGRAATVGVLLSGDGRLVIWAVSDDPNLFDGLDTELTVSVRVDESVLLTEEDQAAVAAVADAARLGPASIEMPLAGEVLLAAGSDVVASVSGAELADPDAWVLPIEVFRARTGPFSALALLADAHPEDGEGFVGAIFTGPGPRCAGPPGATPPELAGLRRISIQSAPDPVTCLDWWAVDLYLDGEGRIAGIALDLWEP
jgi:hypothetical protein